MQTKQSKIVPFTFIRKRIYYFSKRVPADLIHHYRYPRIVQSLRTRSSSVARTRSLIEAARLDEYWSHLRFQSTDMLGKHLLLNATDRVVSSSDDVDDNSPTLGEALSMYLALKGVTKSKTFHAAATRACGYLVDTCGEKTLTDYTRADAIAFRNELMDRNLTGSTIIRIFGSLRAVINFASSESGIQMQNPFTGVYLDRSAGVSERKPITKETITIIQHECKEVDDEMRWLLLLLSDTGKGGLENISRSKSGESPKVIRTKRIKEATLHFKTVDPLCIIENEHEQLESLLDESNLFSVALIRNDGSGNPEVVFGTNNPTLINAILEKAGRGMENCKSNHSDAPETTATDDEASSAADTNVADGGIDTDSGIEPDRTDAGLGAEPQGDTKPDEDSIDPSTGTGNHNFEKERLACGNITNKTREQRETISTI